MILKRTDRTKLLKRIFCLLLLLFISMSVQISAQTYLVNGRVLSNNGEAIENVMVRTPRLPILKESTNYMFRHFPILYM